MLLKDHLEKLKPYFTPKRKCPVCGSNASHSWARWEIFEMVECEGCSLKFINPCLNEQGLSIVYSGHHQGRLANEDWCRKREQMYIIDRDFLLETIDRGNLLDIGCGGGFFLNKFDGALWNRQGVEIDPDTVNYAKQHFNIPVILWDSKHIPLADASQDVIMFRGSFEHMLYPDIVAKEVMRVLKKGGYLYICALPNGDSFCSQLYREKWNQFDAQEHIFLFSPKTLNDLFKPLGFKQVKYTFFYEETPYCNLQEDMAKVLKDYQLSQEGKREQMGISPAFFGNMLNIIFKKV